MADDTRRSNLGRTLTTIGYLGIAFSFIGQAIIGETAAAFFLPALIFMFIGRAASRRSRRRTSDEMGETEPKAEPRRAQTPRPRPQPQARAKARPKPPSREKIDADLETVLAAYRTASDSEITEPESAEPIVIESLEFKPKTSEEMIEEARRKFNKSP